MNEKKQIKINFGLSGYMIMVDDSMYPDTYRPTKEECGEAWRCDERSWDQPLRSTIVKVFIQIDEPPIKIEVDKDQ